MKNKRIIYMIVIMIFVIVLMIINVFRYNYSTIDKNIYDITWYRYNYNNGLYETILFKDGNVEYFKPTSTNNTNSLDNCTKYTYDKRNNSINLNCSKTIKVVSYGKDNLSLDFDEKNVKFFTNLEDSIKYEFEVYYQKSIVEYRKEKTQVLDFSNIKEEKLYDVLKEKEYSKILIMGNRCTSIECTLVLDIMEKWISTNEKIYYFDANQINEKILKYINNINESNYDYNYFNGSYPIIIVSNNNKIVDQYEIKCTGFNCTKYYKNEF